MLSSITSRLAALAMGSQPKEERLLMVFPFPKPESLIQSIESKHPNVKITYHFLAVDRKKSFAEQPKVPDELFRNATILASLQAFPSTPELAANLKFIHLISAGSDHIQKTPIFTDTKVPITTSSGIHGPMISEWVILQMLSNSHKQKLLLEWQKEHFWGPHEAVQNRTDYVGQRIGVLGYGSIGRQVAVVAKAMGMEVYAYTASPRPTPDSKKDNGYIVPGIGDASGSIPSAWFSGLDKASLQNFLSQDLDVLLISVPLTKETMHFIGAEEFAILAQTSERKKAGTFVANISRGSIIVQEELEKFVGEGKLRGAALDVTDPEPLPKDSLLWDVEGVVVTPHLSGLGVAYLERSLQVLERNLTNLEEDKKLINLVDREKGY